MLTAQQKAEAENHLKQISAELQIQQQVKSTIKKNSKGLRELINSLKDSPKQQLNLINKINAQATKLILSLQTKSRVLGTAQENMKNDKEKLNKEKIRAYDEKQKINSSIQQIKQTIKKIRITVEDSIKQQEQKRKKIQADLEKSLDEIRQKIKSFKEDSQKMNQQNTPLREKVTQIKTKMEGMQGQYKIKSQEKDQQVKTEKQELMEKLKALEQEVNKVTETNKQYSAIQKKNFDQKLSIHLRTQKFPEYSSSFESSATTIHQCKQQLFKGVTRLNQANEKIEASKKQETQLSDAYLQQFKKQSAKQQKIKQVKVQKEEVRARILQLQNKLKEKNQKKQ